MELKLIEKKLEGNWIEDWLQTEHEKQAKLTLRQVVEMFDEAARQYEHGTAFDIGAKTRELIEQLRRASE